LRDDDQAAAAGDFIHGALILAALTHRDCSLKFWDWKLRAGRRCTNRQAAVVDGASEQTSTNVQTVASATEELTSSISEIGRQVAQSTEIASRAVENARRTGDTAR
jgi:hypothetical protein